MIENSPNQQLHDESNTQPDETPARSSHLWEDQNEVIPRDHTQQEFSVHPGHEHYGYEAPAPKPQPVYLAKPLPPDRKIIRWVPTNITLPDTTIKHVVNMDRRRSRAFIQNTHATNSCSLTRDQGDSPDFGYILTPGENIELFHNDAIYVAAVTAPCTISYFIERELEEDGQ